MKIAIISEAFYHGVLSELHEEKTFNEWKTLESWSWGLKAEHINIKNVQQIKDGDFDIYLVVLPKKETLGFLRSLYQINMDKVVMLQEGPCWYFQDVSYQLDRAITEFYSTTLGILAHSKNDASYFKQFNKNVGVIRTATNINVKIEPTKMKETYAVIGGTDCSWYNGKTSVNIVKGLVDKIFVLGMGREKEKTYHIGKNEGFEILDYMQWNTLINFIAGADIAVHMMPTHAAHSFQLMCSIANTPCITSKNELTEDLYSETFEPYDYEGARKIAKEQLKDKFNWVSVGDRRDRLKKYHFTEVAKEIKEEINKWIQK